MLVTSMNTKKELLATSLLAISLAAGLGTLSFGLFSGSPPNVRIDVYAKKNGVTSDSFLPLDEVLLEAQVSNSNASIAGAPVTFEVKSPNGTDFLVETSTSDAFGKANVTFQIPWPLLVSTQTTWELGVWQSQATVQTYGQTQNATTSFSCETVTPTIDAYTDKGGHGTNTPGGSFTTSEIVNVYVEIRDELNHTVPQWPVGLDVVIWGKGNYRTAVNSTYPVRATFTNIIDPAISGTYIDIATASYEDNTLTDVITITVTFSG
jgi:hypothetical protein